MFLLYYLIIYRLIFLFNDKICTTKWSDLVAGIVINYLAKF